MIFCKNHGTFFISSFFHLLIHFTNTYGTPPIYIIGDTSLFSGSERSPRGENGNPH